MARVNYHNGQVQRSTSEETLSSGIEKMRLVHRPARNDLQLGTSRRSPLLLLGVVSILADLCCCNPLVPNLVET